MLARNKKGIRIVECISLYERSANKVLHKIVGVRYKQKRKSKLATVLITKDSSVLLEQVDSDDEFVFLGSQEGVFGVFVADFRFCDSVIERAVALVLSEIGELKTIPRFNWSYELCEEVIMK